MLAAWQLEMHDVTALENKPMAWIAFVRRNGTSQEAFSRAISDEAGRLRGRVPAGWIVEARARHAYNPLEGTRKALALASGPAPFDAIISLISPSAELLDQAASAWSGAAERLSEVIEAAQSAAIVGTPHVVRSGDGAYMNAYCLRPAKGKTIAQAQAHWSTIYRRMAQSNVERSSPQPTPSASYAQFHADENASRALAAAAGVSLSDFMGAAVSYSDDITWTNRAIKQSETTTAGEDEELNFIDHGRSCLALYHFIES